MRAGEYLFIMRVFGYNGKWRRQHLLRHFQYGFKTINPNLNFLSHTHTHFPRYYGPFLKLNGEQIRQDVEEMSNIIQKLIKQLVNNPQAKRIAEQVRLKIDKFKIYLPILDAICQQGLNERHWNLISDELGQIVNPELYSTLCSMIEIDILRIAGRLEEIAYAAAKEYELNVQLTNMKAEWTEVMFDMAQYRYVQHIHGSGVLWVESTIISCRLERWLMLSTGLSSDNTMYIVQCTCE